MLFIVFCLGAPPISLIGCFRSRSFAGGDACNAVPLALRHSDREGWRFERGYRGASDVGDVGGLLRIAVDRMGGDRGGLQRGATPLCPRPPPLMGKKP